ncbi:L,D-transpeptidase family protein [Moritella sp. F3]|uniref:L,D-transpeptidase family protein n=1 Tax=Moritella sp. F3 TaxID=2718882 RepID=UPI0018E193AC|nr:L,D-transpeptidase family protein [Moritella sp. F3]GIC79649.1 peptidase [Moritella sp. F1]GIC79795.1 peptidase [Moritella sp. F3]
MPTISESRRHFRITVLAMLFYFYTPSIHSQQYILPESGSRLIGERVQHEVKVGDYFHSLSQQYNIGLIALMASNPTVDPFLPLPGTILELPTRMLLPNVRHSGIVINLPELRLYYFPKNTNKVHVFPVGIGREGRATPEMDSFIQSKIKNPAWTPTSRTRAEYLEKYKTVLPPTVHAGEHNPLGDFALRLAHGHSNYLIHGTNQEFGVGMRISAGCIRMNPVDIEWLFNNVSINDPVKIINKPIKYTLEPDGKRYLEVHSPLSSDILSNDDDENNILKQLELDNRVDKMAIDKVLLLHHGLPINISI